MPNINVPANVSGTVLSVNVSGNYSTNSSGYFESPPTRILSAGSFKFIVLLNGQVYAEIATGFISNSVKNIVASLADIPYANYPVGIKYFLTAEDNNPYMLQANVSLANSDNTNLTGILFSNNTAQMFRVTFPEVKTYNLSLTTNSTSTVFYFQATTIKDNLLINTSFDNTTWIYNSNPISLTAVVYGNNVSQPEIFNGQYSIPIFVGVSTTNYSTYYIQTTKGFGSLSINLYLPGFYTFSLGNNNFTSSFYKTLKVLDSVKSFYYNSSVLTNLANTLINFTVTAIGYSGSIYTQDSAVSLSCGQNSFVLNPTLNTVSGNATFRIYFTQQSTYNCQLQLLKSNLTQPLSFVINSAKLNPDQNCSVDLNPTTCFMCVNNSQVNSSGLCACVPSSFYNSSSAKCQCNPNFDSVNNYCVTCGYFFKATDISASFSKDFKSIVFTFQAPANTKSPSNDGQWLSAFSLPPNLKPFYNSAQWTSTKSCAIYFNQSVNGVSFYVNIDPFTVQKENVGSCSQEINYLYVPVAVPPKPAPVVKVFSPQVVSVSCGSNVIVVYTTTFGNYNYSWTSTDDTVKGILANQTNTSVQIDLGGVSSNSFDVILTVKDNVFFTTGSDRASISVARQKALTVQIDQGTVLDYLVSTDVQLKALLVDACNETAFNYTWSLTVNGVSNQDLLSNISTKAPQLLLIRKSTFIGGNTYVIKVNAATNNGVNGQASIVINAISTPLSVTLNRVSGSISAINDLFIQATAFDPDDPTFKNFTFAWTCSVNGNPCLDSSGNSLANTQSPNLTVSNSSLISGAQYVFSVVASRNSPSKSGNQSVNFYVDKKITGQIIMPTLKGNQAQSNDLIITPQLILNGSKSVQWQISPDVQGLNLTLEYLFIPAGYLKKGTTYLVLLSLKLAGASDDTAVTGSLSFYVNAPPQCKGFSAAINKAGKTAMTALECTDADSNNQVLYQYGRVKDGYYTKLTNLITASNYKLRLASGLSASVSVCDDMLDCSRYQSSISPSGGSRLLKLDASKYLGDIDDPDEVPSLIVYYASSVGNETDFLFLYGQLKQYFSSVVINKINFGNFVTALWNLVVVSGNTTTLSNSTAYEILDFTNSMILSFGSQISSEYSTQLIEIFSYFTSYFSPQQIKNELDLIGQYSLLGSVLKSSVSSSSLNYFRQRLDLSLISKSLFKSGKVQVMFPSDLKLSYSNSTLSNKVVDLVINSYYLNDTVFEITLTVTGDNSNGLSIYALSSTYDAAVNTTAGIQVSLNGTFDTSTGFECVYLMNGSWVTGGCSIDSYSSNTVNLSLYHLSIFSLRESSQGSCGVGSGPITTMSVLIALLSFTVLLFLVDKDVKAFPMVKRFFLLYPISSLFYKQPMKRRAVVLLQVITSELVLLTFIGAFQNYWDRTGEGSGETAKNYYGKQLRIGVTGWVLTQALTVPVFILNSFMIKGKYYHYFTVPVCLFFVLGSFIGLVVMTVYYCKVWTEYWIISWLIFLGIDLIVFEAIYAAIALVFNNEKILKDKESIILNKTVIQDNIQVHDQSGVVISNPDYKDDVACSVVENSISQDN